MGFFLTSVTRLRGKAFWYFRLMPQAIRPPKVCWGVRRCQTLLSIESLEADRAYVERQLAEAGDDAWGTVRHISPYVANEACRDRRTNCAGFSISRSNYASVALIFDGNPVIGAGDIRLDFTTDALDSYQKIISLALAAKLSQGDLPERGRLPGADKSRLFIRDLVRDRWDSSLRRFL